MKLLSSGRAEKRIWTDQASAVQYVTEKRAQHRSDYEMECHDGF